MSKVTRKYNLNIKGVLYIEDDIISVESEETGALMPVAAFAEAFNGKECTLSIAYAEDCE